VIAGPLFAPSGPIAANPHGPSTSNAPKLSPRTPCRPKSTRADTPPTRMDTRLERKDSNPRSRDQNRPRYVYNVTNRAVEPSSMTLGAARARHIAPTDAPLAETAQHGRRSRSTLARAQRTTRGPRGASGTTRESARKPTGMTAATERPWVRRFQAQPALRRCCSCKEQRSVRCAPPTTSRVSSSACLRAGSGSRA
jgi:hypothetical protein